jgi:S-adenosylmethionine decarboxylase proenzyme
LPLGRHVILECYECDPVALKNEHFMEAILKESAVHAGATVLHSYFHKFDQGNGVTGVIALSESHISVHTWPEHRYMAIDVFMCGSCNPMDSIDYIISNISIDEYVVQDIIRGEPFEFTKES